MSFTWWVLASLKSRSHLEVRPSCLFGEVSSPPFPPSTARTSISSSLNINTKEKWVLLFCFFFYMDIYSVDKHEHLLHRQRFFGSVSKLLLQFGLSASSKHTNWQWVRGQMTFLMAKTMVSPRANPKSSLNPRSEKCASPPSASPVPILRVVVLWIYLLSFSFSAFSLLASCAFSAIQRETSSWLSSVVFLSFSSREEKAICRASYSSFSVWFALSRSCRRQRGRKLKADFALAHRMFLYPFPVKGLRLKTWDQIPSSTSSSAWRSTLLDSVRCLTSHNLQNLHADSDVTSCLTVRGFYLHRCTAIALWW